MPRRLATSAVIATLLGAAAHAGDLGTDDIARLSEFVRQDCGSCHGLTLKGGLGSPLLPKDIAHYDKKTLTEVILYGVPTTAMPGWDGVIDRDEAEWIADALKDGRIAE